MKIKTAFMIAIWMLAGNAMAVDLPGNSIYQLGSTWVDQGGKQLELKDLQGTPVVLSMVYLSCRYICPAVISEVQTLEKELSKKLKKSFKIVLVSFDPERDTPDVLQKYALDHQLDLSRWRLITNKDESKIRELAVATDFKYMKGKDGEFTHSYMILLLDQNGVIQSRLDGANQDHKPMIQKIKELQK